MNEEKIRAMIRQEIQASKSNSRFELNMSQRHTHNGTDSPKINSGNILPGLKTSGSVTMASQKDYKFNVNFNPTLVFFYGIVTNGTNKAFIVGQAALGQNLYFQPINTSTVGVGGKFEIVQSSSMFSYSGTAAHASVDEGHIINMDDGSIHARATLSSYGQNFFVITVDTLGSGYQIIGNFFVS